MNWTAKKKYPQKVDYEFICENTREKHFSLPKKISARKN